MHHHVQAVTVLEAIHPENTPIKRNGVKNIKRSGYKDTNNNNVQQPITKESLNVKTPNSDEATEYTILGFIKFKSPIKWLNTISIILIHLIFLYAFVTYPLHGKILTTLWGEFSLIFFSSKNLVNNLCEK